MSGSRTPHVRLGYLASIQSGITVDGNRSDGPDDVTLPYLRVANVQDGHLDLATITEIRVPKSLARSATLKRGDVLMTEGGDLDKLGRGTIWDDEVENCLHQNHVFAVRPDPSKLLPEYLALVTQSSYARAYFESTGTKTTNLASTSSSKIRDFRIPLVDLDEQRRIADFLDAEMARIDALIEAQQSATELIGGRRRRVLEDILIPDNTASVPLGYVTEYSRPIMYGIVLPGPNVEDGVPIVKGGDVAAGRLSLAQLNKTTYEIEANYTRSRLKGGDLVIAIRGSVGEVARVPAEIEGANLTQDAARIAPGPKVQARWLELVLETPSLQQQIGNRITGATVKGINIWDLRRVLIPQVSADEQSRTMKAADSVLATMDDFVSSAKRQLLLLAERRQALITAAVTGGITV